MDEQGKFKSWFEFGPFRLAYLEAILRAADMRASRDAEQREVEKRARVGIVLGKEAMS